MVGNLSQSDMEHDSEQLQAEKNTKIHPVFSHAILP